MIFEAFYDYGAFFGSGLHQKLHKNPHWTALNSPGLSAILWLFDPAFLFAANRAFEDSASEVTHHHLHIPPSVGDSAVRSPRFSWPVCA